MSNKKKFKGTTPARAAVENRRAVFARIRRGVMAIVEGPIDFEAAMRSDSDNPYSQIGIVGTCFAISDTVVATARHVIQPFLDSIEAYHKSTSVPQQTLRVMAFNPKTEDQDNFVVDCWVVVPHKLEVHNGLDVAILHIASGPDASCSPILIAKQPCEEGDEVAVCGFPFGLELQRDQMGGIFINPSFSQGIVSSMLPGPGAPASMRSVFQLDAMINGGNSGGPVFDVRTGEVVGVVTHSVNLTNPEIPEEAGIPTGLARAVHIHHVQGLLSGQSASLGQQASLSIGRSP
jgi:S1-C subfamily serine protease